MDRSNESGAFDWSGAANDMKQLPNSSENHPPPRLFRRAGGDAGTARFRDDDRRATVRLWTACRVCGLRRGARTRTTARRPVAHGSRCSVSCVV